MGLIEVSDDRFKQEVLDSPIPVLIDFWAPWCGPCKMIGPIVEELATEFAGKVKVLKMNLDDNQRVAGQLGITSIPTLVLYKKGEVADRWIGALPKAKLRAFLEKAIG